MCYKELLFSNYMFWCDFGDGKGGHYDTKFNNNIHPSIRLPLSGSQRCQSLSQPPQAKRRGAPWTGCNNKGPLNYLHRGQIKK